MPERTLRYLLFGLGWCAIGVIGLMENSQRWSPYLMLALGLVLVARGLFLRHLRKKRREAEL